VSRVTILAIASSAALLLYILEMVRRRRLREEYSILWLFGSALILILSLKQTWLDRLAHMVGIAYPPSFLFLVGILFILLILIHFSIAISKLHQMNKKIAQELALLKQRLDGGENDRKRNGSDSI
jgi:hypothetical protein